MWHPFDLLNKFLKVEEEETSNETENFVEFYPLKLLLSKGKCDGEDFSKSESFEVPLINQRHTWDCGLACVLMVLRTLSIRDGDIEDLERLCPTTSTWTVDLAYLLQKFSVKFSYYTVTLGANPNFSVETYYKDQLPSDQQRVDMLFQKARDAGIHIECRSFTGEELSLIVLSRKYIAVALVDKCLLSRCWLEDAACIPSIYDDSPSYIGHYIIICGYDTSTNEFEIRDPASSRKHEKISLGRLQEARKAFGTDEDLLLISLEKMENRSSPLLSLFP